MAIYEAKENEMDELIEHCTKQLKILTEDPEKSKYPFMNKNVHFCRVFFLKRKKNVI